MQKLTDDLRDSVKDAASRRHWRQVWRSGDFTPEQDEFMVNAQTEVTRQYYLEAMERRFLCDDERDQRELLLACIKLGYLNDACEFVAVVDDDEVFVINDELFK